MLSTDTTGTAKPDAHVLPHGATFRHAFIIEARPSWCAAGDLYDPKQDLVLTHDYGLKREIEALGGTVRYLDHLCDQTTMQAHNFEVYRFFREWHLDADGHDLFHYRGIDFGFGLRLDIWNDYTFYVRLRLCMETLRSLEIGTIWVAPGQPRVEEVLRDMGQSFRLLGPHISAPKPAYFFPVHRWMDERLRHRNWKNVARDLLIAAQGRVMELWDSVTKRRTGLHRVFVQEYHPTRALLQRLLRMPGIRVVQGHFSSAGGLGRLWRERPIPVYRSRAQFAGPAADMIANYRRRQSAKLFLSSGVEISKHVHRIIEARISETLPDTLRRLDCVIRHMDRHPLDLVILIANLGQVAALVDCVAKARGIPTYLIINGLMGSAYLDEAKYATYINSYSESIRNHYFRGMDNVCCLGDPRMDSYARSMPRIPNRAKPTITVGASGFRNIDLNSYLAVEFEFLAEVLDAITLAEDSGRRFTVILKVRPNGYIDQYRSFLDEYFPGRVDHVVDVAPMRSVLENSDVFVTIYSQTVFEASCLGTPTIYHKTDNEIIDPPFDEQSELVTTRTREGLAAALRDFVAGHHRFDAFLKKNVMEKYVGPLDGGNLDRNLEFIKSLLRKSS